MSTQKFSLKDSRVPMLVGLFGFLALAGLAILYPVVSVYLSEEGGTFHLTFSVADIDRDGDQDVLVHGRRNVNDFEAYGGGILWINQGGAQGGQAGEFVSRINDIGPEGNGGGWGSTLADLDEDGDRDVVIYLGGDLILGMNQGGLQGGQAGVFQRGNGSAPPDELAKKYPVWQYGSVIAGDINNDGKVDAIVLGCCRQAYNAIDGVYPPNFSWVWFNTLDAEGRLSGQRQTANLAALEGLPVADAALADMNGDKTLDLVAVTFKGAEASSPEPAGRVLLNDGRGHFTDSGQRLGAGESTSVALGDLDGDGDVDALVGTSKGATVWINQGGAQGGQAGTFVALTTLAGRQTRNVRLADLDGDADLDAVVLGQTQAEIWWNDGQGHFTRAAQRFSVSDRENLTTGDFNGDGRPDILIAKYDNSVQVWMNDGQGRFKLAEGNP